MGAYYRIDVDPALDTRKRRRAVQKARATRVDAFSRLYVTHEEARSALAVFPEPDQYIVRHAGLYYVGRK